MIKAEDALWYLLGDPEPEPANEEERFLRNWQREMARMGIDLRMIRVDLSDPMATVPEVKEYDRLIIDKDGTRICSVQFGGMVGAEPLRGLSVEQKRLLVRLLNAARTADATQGSNFFSAAGVDYGNGEWVYWQDWAKPYPFEGEWRYDTPKPDWKVDDFGRMALYDGEHEHSGDHRVFDSSILEDSPGAVFSATLYRPDIEIARDACRMLNMRGMTERYDADYHSTRWQHGISIHRFDGSWRAIESSEEMVGAVAGSDIEGLGIVSLSHACTLLPKVGQDKRSDDLLLRCLEGWFETARIALLTDLWVAAEYWRRRPIPDMGRKIEEQRYRRDVLLDKVADLKALAPSSPMLDKIEQAKMPADELWMDPEQAQKAFLKRKRNRWLMVD